MCIFKSDFKFCKQRDFRCKLPYTLHSLHLCHANTSLYMAATVEIWKSGWKSTSLHHIRMSSVILHVTRVQQYRCVSLCNSLEFLQKTPDCGFIQSCSLYHLWCFVLRCYTQARWRGRTLVCHTNRQNDAMYIKTEQHVFRLFFLELAYIENKINNSIMAD